jgi:hypothetical protein
MSIGGTAKLHLGADAEAAKWLRQSLAANPNSSYAHFLLAAALTRLGRAEEAQAEVKAGLAFDPTATISLFRNRESPNDNPIFLKQRHNIYDGMRKAGLPEE